MSKMSERWSIEANVDALGRYLAEKISLGKLAELLGVDYVTCREALGTLGVLPIAPPESPVGLAQELDVARRAGGKAKPDERVDRLEGLAKYVPVLDIAEETKAEVIDAIAEKIVQINEQEIKQ
jgi:hypothetical protein